MTVEGALAIEQSFGSETAASREAVEELFRSCQGRIGRYLIQFVGERELAQDLLQDTFYDALRFSGQLAEVRSREAWLFGIARHRALRALRRRRRFRGVVARLRARPANAVTDEDSHNTGAMGCGGNLNQEHPTSVGSFHRSESSPLITYGVTIDRVISVSFRGGGREHTIPVVGNVWAHEGDSSALRSLTVHIADGTSRTLAR